VQWYVNVPAVLKVWLKLAPGAMLPELQDVAIPASDVDVCVVVSLFVHVTVIPWVIVIGLGLYAVVVLVDAPDTIETVEPDGVVGVVGVVGVELLAHAPIANAATSATGRMNRLNIATPFRTSCTQPE
jgi:hypothetical protein